MTLCDTSRGSSVTVAGVYTQPSLAERLHVLGISPPARVHVLKVSPRKKVWYLRTAFSTVALGEELAACIEVTP